MVCPLYVLTAYLMTVGKSSDSKTASNKFSWICREVVVA